MLHENLKILRTQKGMSQEELAEKLSVVRQTVSKWEKGLSVPDSEMLIQIAEAFEVSVGELLGETIHPEPEKTELQQLSEKLENLNAMMAERNARSRTLMRIAAVCMIVAASVFAAVEIIPMIVLAVLLAKPIDAGTVGIIGGADGPTSVFVTSPDWAGFAVGAAVFAVLLVVGIILLRKSKR
jgi:putative transcriptional regulator